MLECQGSNRNLSGVVREGGRGRGEREGGLEGEKGRGGGETEGTGGWGEGEE